MTTQRVCPNCPPDGGGARRPLLLNNGTKCHGCGYELPTKDESWRAVVPHMPEGDYFIVTKPELLALLRAMPAEFGLRGFPGQRFRVAFDFCYVDEHGCGQVVVEVRGLRAVDQYRTEVSWEQFAREELSTFVNQVETLPSQFVIDENLDTLTPEQALSHDALAACLSGTTKRSKKEDVVTEKKTMSRSEINKKAWETRRANAAAKAKAPAPKPAPAAASKPNGEAKKRITIADLRNEPAPEIKTEDVGKKYSEGSTTGKRYSEVVKAHKAISDLGQPCRCGCGQLCGGKSQFRPGHDAKLKSLLRNSAPTPHLTATERADFIAHWHLKIEGKVED